MLAEDFKMCRVTCFGWGKSGTDKKDTGTIPEESWRDQCHDGRETQEWGTIQANENENLNLNISIPVPSQYITIIPASTSEKIFVKGEIMLNPVIYSLFCKHTLYTSFFPYTCRYYIA